MPKFSVIVPVYNSEKYLEQCIESVLNQAYQDYELILVDDCSKDYSLDICKRYANNQHVIVLEQKSNQGVSAARNRGILQAQGKYITFLDSDDFVAPNYFEVINDLTRKGNCDLICFGHFDYIVFDTGESETRTSSMNVNIPSLEGQDAWNKVFLCSFFASPWNKVFLKSIIDEYELLFDTSCVCYEDYLFNVEYCKHINSIHAVEDPLYYYRQLVGVNHVSKRKWGTRFEISEKVARATNDFISSRGKKSNLKSLRRYTYKAFLVELEASYQDINSFDKDITELIQKTSFNEAVDAIEPSGRWLLMYRITRNIHAYLLSKRILMKLIG